MQYTVFFSENRNKNKVEKMIVFLILLKTLIVGTRKNRVGEAVLTSTHNVCFGSRKRKIEYPCKPQLNYIKMRFIGGKLFMDLDYKGILNSSKLEHITFEQLNRIPPFFLSPAFSKKSGGT